MRLSKLGKVYFSGKQQERVTFQYVFNDPHTSVSSKEC